MSVCQKCRYFNGGFSDNMAECRLSPPVLLQTGESNYDGSKMFEAWWPQVRSSDWCGKFARPRLEEETL